MISNTPVRILIVDDREENHISLKAALEDLNFEFESAYSGEEALKILLNDVDFTLIILDVVMPKMDGFETATYITKRESLKSIPILFLTARDIENQIFKAFEIGAVDYISKPIIPELLKAKVGVFVELSSKNIMLQRQKRKLEEMNQQLTKEIAERKASTNKIKELNETLSNRLKELEALDAFSYSVAHDFKTPLSNISMLTHILKRSDLQSDDEAFGNLKKIDVQVDRLKNLIEDLLIFSHQDTVIKKVETDMNQLVAEVIDELKLSFENLEKYKLSLEQLPNAYCNPGLMKQVWSNILSNAIKYSSNRDEPKVWIKSKKEDDFLTFSVHDNGVGFTKDETKQLFKTFNRLESAKDFNGSGIGLVLTKRIIEKHGGQVWAESDPGIETIFSFCIDNTKLSK